MPTALDLLNSMLTDDEKTQFTALLAKNPKFAEKVGTGVQFLLDYAEPERGDDAAATEAARKAAAAEATRKAAEAAAAATPPPAAAATTAASALTDLAAIEKMFDTKLEALKKDFVPTSALPGYRTEMTAASIKSAHQVMRIEMTHKQEFGEDLDLDALDKYATEHPGHKSITEVYDAMVGQKRMEKKIADGIADGLKLKKSGDTVPAQTTSSALSPAQEIIRKAKAETGNGGESNVSRAAARLANLMKNRESSEAA